jgi:hypothetical protein
MPAFSGNAQTLELFLRRLYRSQRCVQQVKHVPLFSLAHAVFLLFRIPG